MNRLLALALPALLAPYCWGASRIEVEGPATPAPVIKPVESGVAKIELPTAPLAPTAGLISPAQIVDAPQTAPSFAEPQVPVLPPSLPSNPQAQAAEVRATAPAAGEPTTEEPAAEAPATEFTGRVRAILSRLSNPFGTKKGADETPAPTPEQEGYGRFQKTDYWSLTASATRDEVVRLRELNSKSEKQAYVREAGQKILDEIKRRRGTDNIGFHFNLHGGTAQGYVDGGGIRATMGDIANNYSMHGDKNLKVYFFQSKKVALYDILNERNPAMLFFPSRMGSVVSLFRLDAPELAQALADGRIQNFGAISMDFHGMRGVPYSAFLAPPLDVFHQTAKRIGIKGGLSRDEETLAVMRYIEAAALAGDRFVPPAR